MVEAINNGEHVFIRDAEKDDKFECEHCDREVRPVQGTKLPWHFRHVEKNDCIGTEVNPSGIGD